MFKKTRDILKYIIELPFQNDVHISTDCNCSLEIMWVRVARVIVDINVINGNELFSLLWLHMTNH